jgi:hypothetical protein
MNIGGMTIKNSILANANHWDCYTLSGGTTTLQNTIIGDGTCGATLFGDPSLATAAYDGDQP